MSTSCLRAHSGSIFDFFNVIELLTTDLQSGTTGYIRYFWLSWWVSHLCLLLHSHICGPFEAISEMLLENFLLHHSQDTSARIEQAKAELFLSPINGTFRAKSETASPFLFRMDRGRRRTPSFISSEINRP